MRLKSLEWEQVRSLEKVTRFNLINLFTYQTIS